MLNIGPAELMVILVVALLVLGPNKLPEAARQVGRALGELRKLSSGFQAEMRDALKEPVEGKPSSSASPSNGDGALSSSPRPAKVELADVDTAESGLNQATSPSANGTAGQADIPPDPGSDDEARAQGTSG